MASGLTSLSGPYPIISEGLSAHAANVLKNYHKLPLSNPEQLIEDLHHAAQLRNVLCVGSWQVPDVGGKSLPLFVDKKPELFAIDIAYLQQDRDHAVSLTCEVIDSVSSMGLQFPGSAGPGCVKLET